MQLYQNGKPIDPLAELDLSVIPNVSVLDEKYQTKYSLDVELRDGKIKMSDVPFTQGNTPEEKTRKFLETYAK